MTFPCLPPGRYLTAFNQVRTVAGGQTRALLHRTWLFAEQAGVPNTIITFDPFPDYREVEAELRGHGELHPDVTMHNIYDDLRDRPSGAGGDGAGDRLPALEGLQASPEHRSDGTLWRTRYDTPGSTQAVCYDYHRDDGSIFLRTAPLVMDEFRSREDLIQLVDHSGRVVASYSTLGEWWADWVGALTAADPEVFVIYDSMMLPPHLAPRLSRAVHQIATMHMSHVYHPRRWNSPQHPPARRSLEHLDRFGAYIVLTERQREDVETAYGHRSNLFVLPNPGRPVDPPSPVPARDPNLFVVIARLERVKRVDDAIRAFATVSAQAPRARLDIYGEGRQRAACQALIEELGLGDCVRLLGHQPQARDRLWQASGLLVTSRSEGFPLVILEALARGCPVVSYDIKYGPREQIDDDVTGFLAPAGDHVTLGTQCLRLLSSPDLVSRMGRAGQAHVRRDHDQYVGRWSNILRACVDAAPRRTWVRGIELVVSKIGWGAAGKSRRVTLAPPVIGFRGSLSVDAAPSDTPLSDAVIELEAVDDETGAVVPLPISVTGPDDGVFLLGSTFNLQNVSAKASNGPVDLRLRLRFTWQNSYWETDVHGGRRPGRRYEVSYLDDGTVRLRARPRTRRPLRELIRRRPRG